MKANASDPRIPDWIRKIIQLLFPSDDVEIEVRGCPDPHVGGILRITDGRYMRLDLPVTKETKEQFRWVEWVE